MKKRIIIIIVSFLAFLPQKTLLAQCSLCTRNAEQMGDKAGAGLNLSILFLAFTPLILIGYLGYRWWQSEKED